MSIRHTALKQIARYLRDVRRAGSPFFNDRGVSFTVSYVLSLSIAVLLISGVIIATGEVVRDQRESTIRDQAMVVGDEVAASLMTADRLVRKGENTELTMAVTLPDRLADTPYTIRLEKGNPPVIVVETSSPAVSVRVPLTTTTSVSSTSVAGGDVDVVYQPSSDELTLRGGS